MKRFLSLLMVLALLLACVPVHVHGEEHTSESEEVYFEERQDAIDYIEKAISQRVSELHLKLPMEVYSSNILTSLYENAVTEETRWTVAPVDWDGKIEAGFIYLYYAFEYLTTAQQEEELNAAVAELLEQLDYNRFNSFACVKKVYDWVCANITYVPNEEAELIDFTAYGAMINRKATSYGYAVLIKKLLGKMEVGGYLVEGTCYGQEHLWNIVSLGSGEYYLDAALDAGKDSYQWFLKGSSRFTDHTHTVDSEEDVARVEKEDYDRDAYLADHDHSWTYGSCIEEKTCQYCDLPSGEYGRHDFGGQELDCERPRFCQICQQLVPAQAHTYSEDRDRRCDLCGHERGVQCVGYSQTITFTDKGGHQEPQLLGVEGLTYTVLDDYEDSDGSHVWTYNFTFEQVGNYRITAKFASGQETETLDIEILDHEYGDYGSNCLHCDYVDENRHVHNWQGYDCFTPNTCTECGATTGLPQDHHFVTHDCLNEPAKCIYCGTVEDWPIGHKFLVENARYCVRCYQDAVHGCTEGGAYYGFQYGTTEEYRLINTDPRVSVEPYYGEVDQNRYSAKFELKATEPGTYEVTFEWAALYNAPTTVTLVVREHAYENGFCPHCGKTDGTRHLHDWLPATCTQPKICADCGEIYGEPLGHLLEYGPCTEAKTCTRCQAVVEAPSHYYNDLSGSTCAHCDRALHVTCQDVGLPLILSSTEGGDFTLKDGGAGASLSVMEFFARNGVNYWETVIYTSEPGIYEIDLTQKGSEEPLLLTLLVLPHMYENGMCLQCGSLEGEHIHTWKSATCKKPATCAECGETEGTKLDHDYGGSDCSKSAKCKRCGESRSKIKHTYDDWKDDYCNRCNKPRFSYCREGESYLLLYNKERDGYYLKNAPRGVKMETIYVNGNEERYQHNIKLTVDNPDKGVYELVFEDYGGEYDFEFTLEIFGHDYENNACIRCGKKENPTHVHNWSGYDCLNPRYCTTCGETQAEPDPHDWEEATCQSAKRCYRCKTYEGEPLPHDFVGLSCTEPGVCRNCNMIQDKPFGHIYKDGFCATCGIEMQGLPGDVDGNGTLNYNDALLILRASIGLANLTDEQQLLADFDGNGRADYNDALAILRKSIGL